MKIAEAATKASIEAAFELNKSTITAQQRVIHDHERTILNRDSLIALLLKQIAAEVKLTALLAAWFHENADELVFGEGHDAHTLTTLTETSDEAFGARVLAVVRGEGPMPRLHCKVCRVETCGEPFGLDCPSAVDSDEADRLLGLSMGRKLIDAMKATNSVRELIAKMEER